MDAADAAALIGPAVSAPGGTWADLGAGTGTFTRALATLLGRSGRVYAVDQDRRAVAALRRLAEAGSGGGTITPVLADFTGPLALPALDGALLANALHFVPDTQQSHVLAAAAAYLRPGGSLVLVEYDGRSPSRWVPFPVSLARFAAIAAAARLPAPRLVGTRPSAFGGSMYAAATARPA